MQMKIKPLPATEDDQLKTPQHDAFCILLLNKEVLKSYIEKDSFLKNILQNYVESYNKEGSFFEGEVYSRKQIFYQGKVKNFSYELETPVLEKVLKSPNGFIIGYLDLWVTIKLKIEYELITAKEIIEKQKEILFNFGIEVKPTIKSVGEVMRQLQTYKQQTRAHIVVVSTSKDYKTIFEGQGFSFWVVE